VLRDTGGGDFAPDAVGARLAMQGVQRQASRPKRGRNTLQVARMATI
jgi:hypothetical protein